MPAHKRCRAGTLLSERILRLLSFITFPMADRSDVDVAVMRRTSGRPIPVMHATGKTLRRSEEHTSELQSLMRISYAVFCLKKKKKKNHKTEIYSNRPKQK